MKSAWTRAVLTVGAIAVLCALPACVGGKVSRGYDIDTGGDANQGKHLITQYNCGSCHMIPGIDNAHGLVGPPLTMFADRTYVGGEVPNNPENLVKWIQDPESIEPGTAMPKLGVTEQQARDIAAYLYTLR